MQSPDTPTVSKCGSNADRGGLFHFLPHEQGLGTRQSNFIPGQGAGSIPALSGLRSAHPQLHIALSANSKVASLDSGEADIAVRMIEPQGQQNIIRRIGTVPFALCANAMIAKRHPNGVSSHSTGPWPTCYTLQRSFPR